MLSDLREVTKAELLHEKRELQKQLERRRDFEIQIRELKLELDKVQAERRKVDYDRISALRDTDHYQTEIVFLRQQIEDVTRDVQAINDASNVAEKSFRTAENQTRQLDIARKFVICRPAPKENCVHRTALGKLEQERQNLKAQEAEICALRETLEKRRKEKEEAQAKYAVLQEKLRQVRHRVHRSLRRRV